MTQYITIGKIGATFGVQGYLKIWAYTANDNDILTYKPWYIGNGEENHWQPIQVEEERLQHNTIIVKFAGIHTPEKARLLTGKLIAITRDQLPSLKQDEYYWSDLVGLSVINQNGVLYGKVAYLIETGANDVLVIKGTDGKEHAIPYLKNKVILKIDLSTKEILVDWELI